jgi:hypothetical protein
VRVEAVDPQEKGFVSVDFFDVSAGSLHHLSHMLIFIRFPVSPLFQVAFNLVHQGAHDILAQKLIGFFNDMVFVIIFSLEFNQLIVGIVKKATPKAKMQAKSSFRSYPLYDIRNTAMAHRMPTNTSRIPV